MIIRKIFKTACVFALILVISIGVIASLFGYPFPVEQLMYMAVLVLGILVVMIYKIKAANTQKIAFVMFVLSSVLVFLGMDSVGEEIMRFSFIAWIIGLGHQLLMNAKRR